jgi:hypothetical protein
MKKRLISIIITLVLTIALAPLIPAYADTVGPLDHVVISPISANVVVGGTQQFTALGQDSNNVTIPDLTYSWAVVAGGGSINGTGAFMAGNITGAFPDTIQVITARDSVIKTAYASVTIIAAPGLLDHVVISPTSANIVVGGTQQFNAQCQDSNNVTIPGLTYSWAVVAGGGSINGTGLFLAGNVTGAFPDTIQVIVVQDSVTKTAYASVVITAAPVTKPNLPPGWSKGNKNGWDNDTPPGWSHGEKKGWQNGMPPGLAKKNK